MSFYTSLNGLKNAQTDLGVIAHNIANVETNGFKKGNTQFADIVVNSASSNPRMTQGLGARVEAIVQNFALGPIEQTGSANWEATGISGTATFGLPNQGAYGSLLSGALERSNVDIAEELVGLITAQRNFQANAKAIDTATQVSQAIMNLRT